jgi:hypothetical protein
VVDSYSLLIPFIVIMQGLDPSYISSPPLLIL